jgi:hypothetical protein
LKEWIRIFVFILVFTASLFGLKYWRQLNAAASLVQIANSNASDSAILDLDTLQGSLNPTSVSISQDSLLKNKADIIIAALSAFQYEKIAGFVHPELGLHFSPYAFLSNAQVVMKHDLLLHKDTVKKFIWGDFDGSGHDIKLDFKSYHHRFVFNDAFHKKAVVQVNKRQGSGNSIDNLLKFYPNAQFVSYYIPGTERYGEMDWKELKVVFQEVDGNLYLVALVHDEWTI